MAGDDAPEHPTGPPLSPVEATVLGRAGEQALASGHSFLDHVALEGACRADGAGHDAVFGALRSLQQARLVDMHFVEPSRVTLLRLTDRGIRHHLAGSRPDLDDVRDRLLGVLADGTAGAPGGAAVDLAGVLGQPRLVVEVLLEDLRRDGCLVFSRVIGGGFRVHRFDAGPSPARARPTSPPPGGRRSQA